MDGGTLGTDAVLKIANAAGVLTDVTGYLNSSGLPRSVEQQESTTFGDRKKKYRPGLEDGTISLSGIADATIDGLLDGIRGAADRAWEYWPFGDGGAAGTNVKYTGNANLSKYDLTNGGPGELSKFDAELQQTGDVTRVLV